MDMALLPVRVMSAASNIKDRRCSLGAKPVRVGRRGVVTVINTVKVYMNKFLWRSQGPCRSTHSTHKNNGEVIRSTPPSCYVIELLLSLATGKI